MKAIPLITMIFSLLANLLSAEIEIGAPAPKISTINELGEPVNLGAELSEGTNLVFFYPKAMTGGCTKQVCSLRDSWDLLNDRDVTIYGVSSDTIKLQKAFSDRYELPFSLIADTDQTVSKAFGKNRWSRQAYIFKDGFLVWRDLGASTAKQAADVIAALDQLEAKR